MIICSNEEEEKSHIISKLHSCKRPFAQTLDSEQCQHYLKTHFTGQVCSESSQMQPAMASIVDHERYNTCQNKMSISCNKLMLVDYIRHAIKFLQYFVVVLVYEWLHRRDRVWVSLCSFNGWSKICKETSEALGSFLLPYLSMDQESLPTMSWTI